LRDSITSLSANSTYRYAMAGSSPLDRGALPRSPYAAELRRGGNSRSFAPPLEAEFVRLRLAETRTLIRVTSLLALFLAGARGTEQILAQSWSQMQLGQFVVVLAASALLAAVAWGPWFARLYLPIAEVLVPLRNAFVAVTVAGVAAAGQIEALMLLPMLVIGPFFVLGLKFRAALVAAALTVVVYAIATAAFGLALPLIVRSCALLAVLMAACGAVARSFERTARTSFLESHVITELAQRDALTGLMNRRVFDERLEKLWELGVAEGRVIAVALIDVDHFKAYNDRYGHQAGDRALQRVAETLQAFVTRPADLLARYGGEEFAVLLHAVDGFEAEALADRMRRAVSDLGIEHRDSRNGVVTISAGVALVEPSRARRSHGALQLADQALYQAKVSGRNRVELLDQGAHQALKTGVFSKSAMHG
jgi:diguanylate cyclase (GGDEF)-like protein